MGFFSDLVGGITGETAADAAKQAARIQAEAIRNAQVYMMPYYNQGMVAQNQLMKLLGLSEDTQAQGFGSEAGGFNMATFEQDPGYAFRMSEGLKALERSAAGRGGAASGAAMKGVTRFGQDLASQEYQNAYDRFYTTRANRLNPLFNLAGGGRTAAGVLAGGTRDVGEAQASGIVGAANARQQAINQLINAGVAAAGSAAGGYYRPAGGGGGSGGGGGGGYGGGSIYDPLGYA